MPTEELTEETTTDEINEYVDNLLAEVEQEREPKGDAQIISETAAPANEPKPKKEPKETPVVEDKSDDETPAEESTSPEWLDDDMKAEIAAYGIEESDIAGFANREDVERVLNLLDSRFKEGEKTKEPGDEKAKESVKEVQEGQIKLDPDVYDEEIVKVSEVVNALRSEIDDLKARYAEEDARATEERFDRVIDGLAATDIFGKTGSESKKELERRNAIMEDVMDRLNGIERRTGNRPELTEAMVRRSARGIFADEFDKKLLKHQTRRISKQSNGRQGGGATRPSDPREDPRDAADALYKELSQA